MTDQESTGEARARDQALSLLSRAQGLRIELEQAQGHASNAGRAQFSKIIASLSGAEVRLALAADAPASGSSIDLSGIEALIGSTQEEAETAAGQSATDIAGASERSAAAVYAITRTEVQDLSHDLFEQKIFDRYVRFGSAEDEQGYRQREAERQHAITAQLALHTPIGDLNAGGLEAGQMLDAGAHGATASPDFMPHWNKLVEQIHQQREAVQATHKPGATVAFDSQLRIDIRSALQTQGVPADQIDRVLASDDPLKAVTPYLAGDHSHALEKALEQGEPAAQTKSAAAAMPTPTSTGSASVQIDTDFADGASTLPSHGLPEQPRRTAARPVGRAVT